MTIVGLSKITSKGQVTLPKNVRRLLKLDKGANIAFCLSRQGVFISRCKVKVEESSFSDEEWRKIERMTAEKGKAVHTAQEAKKLLREL